MTSLRELLAFNIRKRRCELSYSQEKLAETAGTAAQYIAMIETRRKFPSSEMLERIACALEIDPPCLFSMTGFPAESVRAFNKNLLIEIKDLIDRRLSELEV